MRLISLAFILLLHHWTPVLAKPTFNNEVREHIGKSLLIDKSALDHTGKLVTLNQLFKNDRPTILNFVYYRCPGACTLLLNGLTAALAETEFELGRDFNIVTMTIDPLEDTDLAAGKRITYVEGISSTRHDRSHWQFLTGDREVIKKVTELTGFIYDYDPDTLQYIHPSVLIFVSPDGVVTRYLYGSYFKSENFEHALIESGRGSVGTIGQRLYTWFHDFGRPETGRRYALNQGRVALVAAGLVVLFGLLGGVVLRVRKKTSH